MFFPQRFHSHTCRCSDQRILQGPLGHAGTETSQIYTHLDTCRLYAMVWDPYLLNEGHGLSSVTNPR